MPTDDGENANNTNYGEDLLLASKQRTVPRRTESDKKGKQEEKFYYTLIKTFSGRTL